MASGVHDISASQSVSLSSLSGAFRVLLSHDGALSLLSEEPLSTQTKEIQEQPAVSIRLVNTHNNKAIRKRRQYSFATV